MRIVRFGLVLAILLGVSSVASAKGPKYNPVKARAYGIAPTTVIPVYGGSVRISNGSGRNGRGGGIKRAKFPDWYDRYAGAAAAYSQRLYGPVPGAGGMQFIGGDDMPGTPQYIENPFCTPAYGNSHADKPAFIYNPFCTQED